MDTLLTQAIQDNVSAALTEDVGAGDITALLIPITTQGTATIITRESAVICGQAWVDAVFKAINPRIDVEWLIEEGQPATPNQTLCEIFGPARHLLTGERTALNFLQTLSGTASVCRRYAQLVAHTPVKLLDSRKTIPGLRIAQKYAVTIGGCHNHRLGLYDAFLIKENHITACGSIDAAVQKAREQAPGRPVEVEVETFDELVEAIDAKTDTIMLDNFTLDEVSRAVTFNQGRCKLEVSGGVTLDNLVSLAEAGVDFISIGSLTKHLQAIDLSMRLSIRG